MESILGLVRHTGNDGLFRAVEMSLLATLAGHPFHIHAEGLRGTGKTTVMRAVRRALPRIRRVKNCMYNCDPAAPHCPEHRGLSRERLAAIGEQWVLMPFLEISHSAKVGTVVGSIDLSRLVSPVQPEAALLPGTIPQAHRGIIFVDEVNRLAETAPELADILLDVMGTKPGRVQIEETGLKAIELPVQVSVWAASNPDEEPGPLEEIRRQLSDRFDLAIYTDRPSDLSAIERILAGADTQSWHRPLSPADETHAELYRTRLSEHSGRLGQVAVPEQLRQRVADLYTLFSLESLRAIQAIQLGMRLSACLGGRQEPGLDELASVVPLALRHRVDAETNKKVSAYLSQLQPKGEQPQAAPTAKARFQPLAFGQQLTVEPSRSVSAAAPLAKPQAADTPPAVKPGTETPATQPRPGSSPAQSPGSPDPGGWLNRALSGLRGRLGMEGAGGTTNASGQSLRPGASNPTMPPRPGRFFQQMQEQPSAALAGSDALKRGLSQRSPGGLQQPPGGGMGKTDSSPMPGGPLPPMDAAGQPGQGPTMHASAVPKLQSGQHPLPASTPDPLFVQHEAPPHRARPLMNLAEGEFIRTEEELGRS